MIYGPSALGCPCSHMLAKFGAVEVAWWKGPNGLSNPVGVRRPSFATRGSIRRKLNTTSVVLLQAWPYQVIMGGNRLLYQVY